MLARSAETRQIPWRLLNASPLGFSLQLDLD